MRRSWSTLFLALVVVPSLPAQRWTIQYFYDEPRAQMNLVDLAFPTAERGIAVGWTQEGDHKPKPTLLVTADSGAHWTPVPIRELPRSLFFLNESMGWMVTEEGIWFTEESGRSWRKIAEQRKPDKKLGPVPPGGLILRVWFLDQKHGYAVGYQKTVLQTFDGGRTWALLPDAAKPIGNPAFTAYTQIAFDGGKGLIIGASVPPRRDLGPLPSWMDPQRAANARQVPTLTLLLQTTDGGGHWIPENAPLLGLVAALKMAGPFALDVFSFGPGFDWPSEVYRINVTTGGGSSAVFRKKDRRVTDAALFPGPQAFLAAVEPPGQLNTVPIPGKVKILASSDPNLTDWKEMEVDYRAVATTLILAGPDARHMWAATDTGMILRLVE
jgi:photosynthesis system II assembly factor YCF48-like protein